MLELPYYNTFFKTATPPAVELARRSGRDRAAGYATASSSPARAPRPTTPSSSSSGYYWNLKGKPRARRRSSARDYGYHGGDLAAASLTGMALMHAHVGPAAAGLRPHRATLLVRPRAATLTPDEFGLQSARALEDKILELGRGQCRGVHRRADPGCRRRHHPARDLLARGPADLPRVRRAAGRRRSDLRLRPHRPLVGLARTSASSPTS